MWVSIKEFKYCTQYFVSFEMLFNQLTDNIRKYHHRYFISIEFGDLNVTHVPGQYVFCVVCSYKIQQPLIPCPFSSSWILLLFLQRDRRVKWFISLNDI